MGNTAILDVMYSQHVYRMHFSQYYGSSAALGYVTGMYTDNYTNLYGFITITRYTQLLCTMLPTMYGIRISYRDRQSNIDYQMHVLFYSLVRIIHVWMDAWNCSKKNSVLRTCIWVMLLYAY